MADVATDGPRDYETGTPAGAAAGRGPARDRGAGERRAAAGAPDGAPADARRRPSRTRVRMATAAVVAALGLTLLIVIALADPPVAVRAGASAAAVAAGVLVTLLLRRTVVHLDEERARLAAREADALRMAELDDLTGLGNYRMFTRQLQAEVARSRRHDDPFSLVLLDLDGFKAINDELGHLAGDDALRHVAMALRETLREEDVCCRQGGDEFAVIAVRAGEREAAELAERLTRAIGAIPFGVDGERRLGAGAGWATFGRPARSADELILRADAALRECKRATAGGRGTDGRGRPAALGSAAPPRAAARRGRGETARLALLAGLARALAGARDERTLAETTVAFLAGAFDTVGSAALAIDGEPDDPRGPRLVVLGSGGEPPAGGGARLAARESVRRALAAGGTAIVVDEAGTEWPGRGAVRSELAVAVRDGDGAWGCLLVACDRTRAYGLPERALAEAIARQLGRALSSLRVLDELRVSGFGDLYRIAGGADAAFASGAGGAGSDGGASAEGWRLADLAWRLGRALGLGDQELRTLYVAALFRDVGTVGVPAALLEHPGELQEQERAIVRERPLIGERILRDLPLLRDAAPVVRHGHERWDGRGYPDGLAAEAIPLAARILHACIVLVSMTSGRPWRPPRPLEAARAELRRVAGTQLDPRVVEALLELVEDQEDLDDDDQRCPQPAGV